MPSPDPVPESLVHFTPAALALYHRNPRVGSVKEIEDSLRAHGQYKPVVVNLGTHTGRPNEVLAGNHTVVAFRNLQESDPDDDRWRLISAYVIDVDDDRAARIVLVDNRTAELGGFDTAALATLLDWLPDLEGTAYTDDDLSDLTASLEEALPSFVGDDSADKPAPRLGEDGLIRSNDLVTDAGRYEDKATRLVVMAMGIERFVWVQERLAEVRNEFEVETNSEALVCLLEARSGLTAPADEEAEGDDDRSDPDDIARG